MAEPRDIVVKAGPFSYPVIFGRYRQRLADILKGSRRIAVISNATVFAVHGGRLLDYLPKKRRIIPIMIGDGERFKTLRTVAAIYGHLFDIGFERNDTIIAFGGGVVTDTAGFAAATFMRGVGLIHVPTTLLAMADSSIGGKVGMNHALGKNQIGTFYQPQAVVIDPSWLVTLGRREMTEGLAEILKAGMMSSARLTGMASRAEPMYFPVDEPDWLAFIRAAIRAKADIVASDVYDRGRRMILNFGHTFGHAIETAEGYRRYHHGEAVTAGMAGAIYLSHLTGLMSERQRRRCLDYLTGLTENLPPLKKSVDDYLAPISMDKKRRDMMTRFVLLERIGVPIIGAVNSRSMVVEAISQMKDFVNSGGRT